MKPYRAPLLICFLAVTSVLPTFAKDSSSKTSEDVKQSMGQGSLNVIIQYRKMPSSAKTAAIASNGGAVSQVFSSVPAVSASLASGAIQSISADPDVTYITMDRTVGSRTAWYSAEPINAPAEWALGLDGTGIGIAVIDSGINGEKDDLRNYGSRVVFSHNFVPRTGSNNGLSHSDPYGHGTHVAGIIAGNGSQSTGSRYFRTFKGIAPNANLIDLRVLDENGQGTDSNVIAAIEMAIALKDKFNIRIINLSLGRPVYESYTQDPLCQAVEQAWKAGILVVVAAGNDGRLMSFNPEGYGTINSPGNDPYVLTAGAVDTNNTATIVDDTVASYSSKGPSLVDDIAKPDIMAPGSQIASIKVDRSELPTLNPTLVTLKSDYELTEHDASSREYFPLSGTSMASAVVSGASALLLQARPTLTPDQVKGLLMRDAQKNIFPTSSTVMDSSGSYTSFNDLLTVGAGYLDIQASIRDARSSRTFPAGYALSPSINFDPTTDALSLVVDPSSLWNFNQAWTPLAVYGSQSFVNPVKGATIIWGRSSLDSSTIIWGRGSLSGSTIIWGRSAPTSSSVEAQESSSGTPLGEPVLY